MVQVICILRRSFVHSFQQWQLVTSYLLQAVASSFVEITASSCDILFLKQKLDQQFKEKHFKQAAMFDCASKSTMGWDASGEWGEGDRAKEQPSR